MVRSDLSNKINHATIIITRHEIAVVKHIRKRDGFGINTKTKYPAKNEVITITEMGIKILLIHDLILIPNNERPKNSLAIEQAAIHPAITQLAETGLPPKANTSHAIGMLRTQSKPVVI